MIEPQRVRSASDMKPAAGMHANAPIRYATKIVVPCSGSSPRASWTMPDHELDEGEHGHHGHTDEVPVLGRLVAVGGPAAPGGEHERGDGGRDRQGIKHDATLLRAKRPDALAPGVPRRVESMKIQAEALLFDNDGTLVSSLESVNRCWTRWAAEYGITAEEFARVELHGRPAAEIVADLLPGTGAPRERSRAWGSVPEAVVRIEELEVEDVVGGVHLLPGTKALLDSLPADRWAVVTSATRRLAEARLGEAGIRPKTLVTADDITRGKPDPEPFLLAARQLGVDPARCVVFEDAPAGLQAGRAAGMTTVALTTTHRADELDADVVAGDLSAVSALVTSGGVEISVED